MVLLHFLLLNNCVTILGLFSPQNLSFSYINQRNREWNIVESEKALVVNNAETVLCGDGEGC